MAEKNNNGAKVAVGAGLAALAAVAAGAVFLYGTDAGKKQRKHIKGWMLKAKGEVLEKIEGMKEWSEDAYSAVVDSVAAKYKDIDPEELAMLVQDLKGSWKTIKKQLEKKGGAKKKASTKKGSK